MSEEVVRRFHELYYGAADRGGTWRATTWMGVPVAKCPLDLWAYQEMLFQVRPEVVTHTLNQYAEVWPNYGTKPTWQHHFDALKRILDRREPDYID